MGNIHQIFSEIENKIKSTIGEIELYSNEDKNRSYERIKTSSVFLENQNTKLFHSIVAPVELFLKKYEKEVDEIIESSDNIEILNNYLKIDDKKIKLLDGISLLRKIKPEEFCGQFICLGYLMRDENYLYANIIFSEVLNEKL